MAGTFLRPSCCPKCGNSLEIVSEEFQRHYRLELRVLRCADPQCRTAVSAEWPLDTEALAKALAERLARR